MPNWKKIALSGSSPEFNSVSIDNAVTASIFTGSLLRLDENGTGLRMTNVGAFDNSSGNFRIFANQDLILATNGQSGTALTIDQTTKDATFQGDITTTSTGSFGRVEATSFTGSFVGDGSGLTNISTDVAEVSTVTDTFSSSTSKVVTHNFGTKNVIVTVYNDSDQQIIPSTVTTTDLNSVTVTFDTASNGRVVVAKGGHLVSGSAFDSNALGGKDAASYATTGSNQFNGTQYITGSLIPGANETYDLGTASSRWRDLYLSGSTIVLGDTKITTDASGNVEFKDSTTDARKVLKVDEIEIGSGSNVRKIKVDNGKVSFTDKNNNTQSTKTGHILPSATNTYDLGSPTEQFRHLYLSTASLYMDGTKILSSDSNTLTFTTDAGQSIKILETGGDDITLQTDTGNIELKGTVEIESGKKITDSAGTVIQFGDSLGITGSIEVSGTVDGIDLQAMSSSLDTRISNISTDFADITNKPTLISSSAQLAADISGSFTSVSASIASDIANISTDFADITNKPTLISSSAQIAADISGSFTSLSSSIALDISSISTDFADIENKPTLISGSAQLAADISGSFTSLSSSIASDIATNTAKTGYSDSLVKTKLNTENVVSGSASNVKTFLSISSTDISDVDAFSQSGTYASLRAQGTTASDVGLGNVTNESKATMFTNAALTGTPTAPTQTGTDDSTKIATTAFVQGRIDNIIGNAGAALDTLGELSASLANATGSVEALTTSVNGKLQKDQNLSDLTNASTARTNLGLGTAATTDSTAYATAAQGTNADTAYGWGDHASAGYITSADGGNAQTLDSIDSTGFIRDLGNVTITDFDTLSDGFVGSDETTATNQPLANHNITFTLSNDASSERKAQVFFGDTQGSMYWRAKQGSTTGWHPWEKIWTNQNDGANSGLDADTVDGIQASSFVRSDTSDTMNGVLTINDTSDAQLMLASTNTWTGIGFNDGDAAGTSYLWHYGATNTWAFGGSGSTTAGKRMHIDGGVTIGSNLDSTSVPADGLVVEGAVVLKGQASNYDGSTGRTSYWNYDDKVALALEPAADDGAVAIFFKSIGNAPSDFAYIAFDEDYGEAGVSAGENCALILGCENDGGGSSDHVRVKGRLVVEADMSSSDPTMAFQVKSSNTTSDLFNVARGGGGYLSGTFNVTGDVVAYYSSDERLKDNLKPIDNSLEKLKKISGYEFDWNDKQDVYEGHDIGVVAQEVEEVLPEIVATRDNGYKAVKYEKLTALLIEAVKEQQNQIEKLTREINELKNE